MAGKEISVKKYVVRLSVEEREQLRARQQARPYRLGGSPQGPRFRVRQDQWVPTCLIVAPCSGPSRRGLQTLAQVATLSRRPALTALARGAPLLAQAGTKERLAAEQ